MIYARILAPCRGEVNCRGFNLRSAYVIISAMLNDKFPEKLISALGTATLAAVFAHWCAGSSYGAAGYAAAVISALLMLALCLRFVPEWCAFWREKGEDRLGTADGTVCARIFALIIIWDVVILILGFVLRKILGYDETVGGYVRFWLCTDSQHYMDIARDWYLSDGKWDRLVQLVFLPGYPVVVRLFSYLTGDCLAAGLFVSALCFAGSGVMLYKLMRLDMESAAALRAVKFFALCPAAFFFAAPMSESLFVLCTMSCLYLVRTGRIRTGGLLGAYAAFTRSPGLILVVPILFELVRSRAKPREYLALFMVPLGFAAYCMINYSVSGDAFKFMEYQSIHWNQRLGWFFGTAAYQTENAVSAASNSTALFWGLWLPNLLAQLLSLAAMIFAAKRIRASYTAYFIAYFVVTMGATWLLSAPRYLAAMLSLPAAMSALAENARTERVLILLSVLMFFVYFIFFLLRWQVW